MRIHHFQHVPYEGLGFIHDWCIRHGHVLTGSRLYAGEPMPDPSAYDMLVVMGGPMNVHDESEHAWLAAEKGALEAAIHAGKAVLGICLGAQLLAHVLGARVYRNPEREVGWFPVHRVAEPGQHMGIEPFPASFHAYQWHGDTFDLPVGARHLARSEGCENQAFEWGSGRVLGLQFHLEVTRESIRHLVAQGAEDLKPGRYVQAPPEMMALSDRFMEPARALLMDVLDGLSRSAA